MDKAIPDEMIDRLSGNSRAASVEPNAYIRLNELDDYALVENSEESWPVTDYDLISPDNAKE